MGEVTNVYVKIQNIGEADIKSIYAIASATDEGRSHPAKSLTSGEIPYGYERVIRLTVDTTSGKPTGITVKVAQEGQTTTQSTNSCYELDKSQAELLEKAITIGIQSMA